MICTWHVENSIYDTVRVLIKENRAGRHDCDLFQGPGAHRIMRIWRIMDGVAARSPVLSGKIHKQLPLVSGMDAF